MSRQIGVDTFKGTPWYESAPTEIENYFRELSRDPARYHSDTEWGCEDHCDYDAGVSCVNCERNAHTKLSRWLSRLKFWRCHGKALASLGELEASLEIIRDEYCTRMEDEE